VKRVVVAGGGGVLAQVMLFGLGAWWAHSSLNGGTWVLFLLQTPGFLVAVLVLRPTGLTTLTGWRGDAFEGVIFVVNAVVFSFVILGAMKVRAHLRRAK